LQIGGTVVFWGNTNLPAASLPTNMLGVKAISAGFQHNLALASDGLPPLLTYPPAGFAPVGGTFTFSLTGVPVVNVQYQWQFDGTNITGATNSTLTLTGVDSADAGSYRVVISNASGSATSLAATFNLAFPPQILSTTPAAPSTNWINTNITLSIGMSTVGQSAYPLSYQWQLNGTNIAAATNAVYTIYNPVAACEGNYTVVITNALGSTNVTWTVLMAFPGMVQAWGSDGSGEINRPVNLTNAAAIAAGEYQSVAVTDSGAVLQWGQYSDGTNFYSVTNTNVVSLPPTSNVVAVAAGLGQALALKSEGTITNWGLNGAWGNSVPASITNGVKAVACGDQFDLVLLTNGTVLAWGYGGTDGSLTNVPSSVSNAIAIAASGEHSLALLSNGTVVGWGYSPAGETNVPAGLSNVVAIATGLNHNLALISTNGSVVAWGTNNFGQTNVPAGLSNVLAIAAGANHSVALSNDSITLVAWGDNSSGQTTLPNLPPATSPFLPPLPGIDNQPPMLVRSIAAGGAHTMATIFSPLVQYPVDVSNDLLLIYNTNSLDSSNVCQYYLAHRPMVGNANVLGIGCTTNDPIYPPDYTNIFLPQVQGWLSNNPTKRPLYVILFQNLPTEVDWITNMEDTYDLCAPSVQYQLHYWTAPGWYPFVSAINMNGLSGTNFNSSDGTNDCIAYINKLAYFWSNEATGQLIISASCANYGNTDWYFDDSYKGTNWGYEAELGVLSVNPSASITYSNTAWITDCANVAGYFNWGFNGAPGPGYATNGILKFTGNSDWYVIETEESFNGQRVTFQGNYLRWFSTNAFGGANYSNTPVGAVTQVEEPGTALNNPYVYFGLWAAEKTFACCAWNSFYNFGTPYIQAVGDPFTKR
jgi:hypothetical protein